MGIFRPANLWGFIESLSTWTTSTCRSGLKEARSVRLKVPVSPKVVQDVVAGLWQSSVAD